MVESNLKIKVDDSEVDRAQGKIEGLGSGSALKGIKTLSNYALAAGGAIAGLGASSVRTAAEVDKSMRLANTIMGSTAEEAEALDKAMQEAASNSVFTMGDAANATLNFARAGLDAEQAASALAPAMNLAAGEAGNLDTVSAGLVATINAFHGDFEDAGHYADVFAAACNNSALDVDSLSQAMGTAAPVFSAAGYSVEDAALYMGIMADNGIDANRAANSLKTGFSRLISPSDKAAKVLDGLGISVTDANGEMKDCVTIQEELHEAFMNLSESEQIEAASTIFGKNQMAPWLALINTAPDSVDELSGSIKNCSGETDNMAETMTSGLGGSLEKLKSTWDVTKAEVGKIVGEYIQPIIEKIQELLEEFNNLPDEEKEAVIQNGIHMAEFLLAAGAIGKVAGFVGDLIEAFGQIGGAIAPVVGEAGPIALAAVAFGGLAAVLETCYENSDEFRDRADETWGNIKQTGEDCFGEESPLRKGLQDIAELLHELAGGDNDDEGVGEFKTAWEDFCAIVEPIITPAFDTIDGNLETMETTFNGSIKVIIDMIKGLIIIIDALVKAWETAKDKIDEVKEAIKRKIEDMTNAVKGKIQEVLEIVQLFIDAFGLSDTSIGKAVTDIKNSVADSMDSTELEVETAMGVVGKLQTAWETLRDVMSNPVNAVIHILKKIGEAEDDGKDGSHAHGLGYVPYNGYMAELHEGEMVLTKAEAERYRVGESMGSGVVQNISIMVPEGGNAFETAVRVKNALSRSNLGLI